MKLCFSGWIKGCDIEDIYDKEGNKIDVRQESEEQIAKMLSSGEYSVELQDCLLMCEDASWETFDFEKDL